MIHYSFIGAGRLGSAMMEALIQRGVCQPGEIGCTSKPADSARLAAERLGVRQFNSIDGLLSGSDTIILAVKPQQLSTLGSSVAEGTRGRLVISVLAGTPIGHLSPVFPKARNIVRTMPNTPARIGAGMTAFCTRDAMGKEDRKRVDDLLAAMGRSVAVNESDMDAVTAVSGSGPAYVFEFVAALRNAGHESGLAPDIAYKLALETVLGSARLLARLDVDPETLRDEVTSPNGTTMAALAQLEKDQFQDVIKRAVQAAKERSEELSAEA